MGQPATLVVDIETVGQDPETIPAGYVARPATVAVDVRPGKPPENIKFELIIPPRPVIEKSLPAQQGSLELHPESNFSVRGVVR